MKLQTLMVTKSIVCMVLGAIILAVPSILYGIFGAALTAAGAFAAREYGASLIGNMLVTWFVRNAKDSDARRAIVLGLCVYDGIGFLVTLAAVITGLINPLGWLVVILYLFFALGFGYYFVKVPQPAVQPKTI
jgi:hypothetical protein